ncbi:MAG: hypothetical protein SFZ02_18800 [bacterium]|nr:hypothetical protein [bacterium]
MKYKLSWLIEKKVIFAVLETDLETEEFRQFMIQFSEMVGDLEKIYVIMDVTKISSRMHDIRALGKVYTEHRPSASGFTILIGGNAVTRFLTQMVLHLVRLEARFVKDFDEAMAVLYRMDVNLPPITMDIKTLSQ